MFTNKASILLIASALLMLPGAAAADPGKGDKQVDKHVDKHRDKHSRVTVTAAGKGHKVTADALMERYGALAGSPENAKSLVDGLRTKSEVVLVGESMTPPPPAPPPCVGRFCAPASSAPVPSGPVMVTVTFMPMTDAMGWGNVDVALALAEADLNAKSVTNPKPEQVKAALMGGQAGDDMFEGILKMRADGNGWGHIAESLGFELK